MSGPNKRFISSVYILIISVQCYKNGRLRSREKCRPLYSLWIIKKFRYNIKISQFGAQRYFWRFPSLSIYTRSIWKHLSVFPHVVFKALPLSCSLGKKKKKNSKTNKEANKEKIKKSKKESRCLSDHGISWAGARFNWRFCYWSGYSSEKCTGPWPSKFCSRLWWHQLSCLFSRWISSFRLQVVGCYTFSLSFFPSLVWHFSILLHLYWKFCKM